MENKSDSRSFAPFLERMGSTATQAEEATAGEPLEALLTPLKLLADSDPLTVQALQERAGLDFGVFAGVLESLKKLSLVELSGLPGRETVKITPSGRALVEISRAKA